jgi:hypothetical protein
MSRKQRGSLLLAGVIACLVGTDGFGAYIINWYDISTGPISNQYGSLIPVSATNFFVCLFTSASSTIPAYTLGDTPVYSAVWQDIAASNGKFYTSLQNTDTTPNLVSGQYVFTRIFERSVANPLAYVTLTTNGLATMQVDASPSEFNYRVSGAVASDWTVIPEPATLGYLLLGVGSLVGCFRRRKAD